MARKQHRKPMQTSGFDQSHNMDLDGEKGDNYGLKTFRSQAGKAGDTGTNDIVGAYKNRRAIAGNAKPITERFSAERRKYNAQARAKKDYQKPAASFRQYNFPALAPIPQQGK